jgi:hypothetical protein
MTSTIQKYSWFDDGDFIKIHVPLEDVMGPRKLDKDSVTVSFGPREVTMHVSGTHPDGAMRRLYISNLNHKIDTEGSTFKALTKKCKVVIALKKRKTEGFAWMRLTRPFVSQDDYEKNKRKWDKQKEDMKEHVTEIEYEGYDPELSDRYADPKAHGPKLNEDAEGKDLVVFPSSNSNDKRQFDPNENDVEPDTEERREERRLREERRREAEAKAEAELRTTLSAIPVPLNPERDATTHVPDIKWAQRKNRVFITVPYRDVSEHKINVDGEGNLHLEFKAKNPAGRLTHYKVNTQLFATVDPARTKTTVTANSVVVDLFKEKRLWWDRLLLAPGKRPWVKTDWDLYRDPEGIVMDEPQKKKKPMDQLTVDELMSDMPPVEEMSDDEEEGFV